MSPLSRSNTAAGRPLLRSAGAAAGLLFVLATLGFGAALDGYAQGVHPVALLGAGGVRHAVAFNLLGWILPGLLAAVAVLDLQRRLPPDAGWLARVGGQLLLLATLAFVAMGVLPLDIEDLDGVASQRHASAWMVWVLGFAAGALLLGVGSLRRALPLAGLTLACGGVAAVMAFGLQGVVPAPVAQRGAFAAWVLWLVAAPWLAARRTPGR